MKLFNLILSTVLSGGVLAAPLADAHAGSCDSGAKKVADIWEKVDDVVIVLGCAGKLKFTKGGELEDLPKCLLDAKTRASFITQMVKFYNDKIAKDGPGSTGPRRLALGEDHQGRIVSSTGRMFITEAPILGESVDIELEKLDGRGKAEVTVCTHAPGQNDKAWTFVVDGKEAAGKVFKKTLTGVQGRVIKVHIDGRSLTDTLKYRLRATAK